MKRAAVVPKSIAASLADPPLGLSGNILSTLESKNKPTSPLPTTRPLDLVPILPTVAPFRRNKEYLHPTQDDFL